MSILRGVRIGAHLTTASRNKYLASIGAQRSRARTNRKWVWPPFCLRFRISFRTCSRINETNILLPAQPDPSILSGPEQLYWPGNSELPFELVFRLMRSEQSCSKARKIFRSEMFWVCCMYAFRGSSVEFCSHFAEG